MKKKVRFIVNPFSGLGKKKNFPLEVESILKNKLEYEIVYTEYRAHAAILSREAKDLNFDAVIAVGGDGSVNEVAREIINTPLALGIIPSGSGNGVARSLKLPLNTTKALEVIGNFTIDTIDTGLINKKLPFIGVSGIGFDAHIGHLFLDRKVRGFAAYVAVVAKEYFNYKSQKFTLVDQDGNLTEKEAFVLCFANTSQYGNNAFIAPAADPRNGRLEMVVISKFPKLEGIKIISSLFRGTIDKNYYYETASAKEFKIQAEETLIHVDGEPHHIKGNLLIEVNPASLKVIS